MKNVLLFIGGASPEHEVSLVTGLQVLENIDTKKYRTYLIYVSELGEAKLILHAQTRKDFIPAKGKQIYFGYDKYKRAPYIFIPSCDHKIEIYAAINAMHGGMGEGGGMAGAMDMINLPQTSETVESAAICMNKVIAKTLVANQGIAVLPFYGLSSLDKDKSSASLPSGLQFPLIIKPAHFGSSIALATANNQQEMKLATTSAFQYDNELIIENYLSSMTEYNCSVKLQNEDIIVSEFEEPIKKHGILNFKDKYQGAGKKMAGGMENLSRILPAKLDPEIKTKLIQDAKTIYQTCRCKGVVRIDWIYDNKNTYYFNEINSIPGSFANYLWEIEGQPFQEQLTQMIEQAVLHHVRQPLIPVERSSIVSDFILNSLHN